MREYRVQEQYNVTTGGISATKDKYKQAFMNAKTNWYNNNVVYCSLIKSHTPAAVASWGREGR